MHPLLKAALPWLTMGGMVLATSMRVGGRVAALEINASEAAAFRREQIHKNEEITSKLSRVEAMVEMLVRERGMNPPRDRR